jgi:hypothetical protein
MRMPSSPFPSAPESFLSTPIRLARTSLSSVPGDDVAAAPLDRVEEAAADPVAAAALDDHPARLVPEVGRPVHVGPDVVALHEVAGGRLVQQDARAAVAGDQVALGRRGAADLVERLTVHVDAVLPVGERRLTGEVGADLVALDDVAIAVHVDAVSAISGDQVPLARPRAADLDPVALVYELDAVGVGDRHGAGRIGPDPVAEDLDPLAERRDVHPRSDLRFTIAGQQVAANDRVPRVAHALTAEADGAQHVRHGCRPGPVGPDQVPRDQVLHAVLHPYPVGQRETHRHHAKHVPVARDQVALGRQGAADLVAGAPVDDDSGADVPLVRHAVLTRPDEVALDLAVAALLERDARTGRVLDHEALHRRVLGLDDERALVVGVEHHR